MADVFCNNCGHQNPPGANFCSSCGHAARARPPRTRTRITFPIDATPEAGEDELPVDLDDSRPDGGRARRRPGPQRRLRVRPRALTSPRPAATPRATSSSTTSPCRAATPRSSAPTAATCVRDVGSLNGTYLNRRAGRGEAPLANGDELQIGKFKLVFYASGDTAPDDDRAPHLSIGEVLALLQDEFPDVTISKIRFLESQGLHRPRAHAVGLPEVLRRRHRAAALDPRQQREHFLPLKVIKDRLDRRRPRPRAPRGGPAAARRRPGADAADPASRPPPAAGAPPRAGRRPGRAWPRRSSPPGRPCGPSRQRRRRGRRRSTAVAVETTPRFTTAELAAAAGIADRDVERLGPSA